jgi:hypothetical protein
MLLALQDREAGLASLEGAAAFGHRPHRFHTAALGDAGLAQRLKQTAALAGHSGAVNTLTWTDGGELLASGGEDCRLRLWRGAGHPKEGSLLHSLDTVRLQAVLYACPPVGSHAQACLLLSDRLSRAMACRFMYLQCGKHESDLCMTQDRENNSLLSLLPLLLPVCRATPPASSAPGSCQPSTGTSSSAAPPIDRSAT